MRQRASAFREEEGHFLVPRLRARVQTEMKPAPKFKIEKGIPIPSKRINSYPFGEMNVGDSFSFPADKRASVACSVRPHSLKGKKFTVRKITNDTARVWRVK